MHYQFDIEVATEYGIKEAVVINNLLFWIFKNKADEKHSYEDRTWTFNSIKSFSVLYPFWSLSQTRRVMESLIKQGVLLTGNFNKKGYDRTAWYAFQDEDKWLEPAKTLIWQNQQMDLAKSANGFGKNDKPIPDNKTQIENTYIKSWLIPNWINVAAWQEFEQHRKDIRKPLTDLARTKAANLLKDLTHEQQQNCIDNSIQSRWPGLYPEKVKNETHNRTKLTAVEQVEQAIRERDSAIIDITPHGQTMGENGTDIRA